MSLPTTGTIRARVLGETPSFDGETWTGGSPFLLGLLNKATPDFLRTHVTVDIAAERILSSIADEWEILEARLDEWHDELPADHED